MKPQFRIVADGTDITRLINDRLLMLRTLDKPGMESDEFELRIDDRDQAVSLPSRGAKVEVFLGYDGAQLTRINSYTVDEVELTGPPDTLVIRGKASDMRGSGKTTRNGSFEGKTLAEIVATVARRNGWIPACDVQTVVPRADQLGESDYNFITRIARLHDCTAKVANGKLLVLKRQAGVTASGKTLPAITIRRSDVSRYSFRLGDRSTHKSVKATHHNAKPLPPRVVMVGCEKPPAPEAWFMEPFTPDLTQRMLNELSASPTPVTGD